MGTYGLEGVILEWRTDRLTAEQAIGQILLLLRQMEQRVVALEAKTVTSQPTQAPAGAGGAKPPHSS